MNEQPPRLRPTVGRVVVYRLSEQDALLVNERRAAGEGRGNTAREGDECPLHVVVAWDAPGDPVNGQVLLDGDDRLWATSRCRGDGPGFWQWPTRT